MELLLPLMCTSVKCNSEIVNRSILYRMHSSSGEQLDPNFLDLVDPYTATAYFFHSQKTVALFQTQAQLWHKNAGRETRFWALAHLVSLGKYVKLMASVKVPRITRILGLEQFEPIHINKPNLAQWDLLLCSILRIAACNLSSLRKQATLAKGDHIHNKNRGQGTPNVGYTRNM